MVVKDKIYKPLRIDLTDSIEKCAFCPNSLRSYKSRVLENMITGEIVNAGPHCAAKYIAEGYSLRGIPDLTRFTKSLEVRDNSHSAREKGDSYSQNRESLDKDRQRAIEYLLLREAKLKEIRANISYKPLAGYYKKHLDIELEDSEIRHINNIEAKAPESLKLLYLQQAYNTYFWVNIAVDKLKDNVDKDFLDGIKQWVADGKILTDAQLNGINNWLKNIDGSPVLK